MGADLNGFLFPCPCGDEFFLSLDDLSKGEVSAFCMSCTLVVKALYSPAEAEYLIKAVVSQKEFVQVSEVLELMESMPEVGNNKTEEKPTPGELTGEIKMVESLTLEGSHSDQNRKEEKLEGDVSKADAKVSEANV